MSPSAHSPPVDTDGLIKDRSLKCDPPQKHICIIGAGPAGLTALKTILETPQFNSNLWKPIAFEARENIGGIWLPAPPTDDPPLTPLYDSLTTNLPHPVMAFPNFPFPPSTPVYPHASVVRQYLVDYAAHFNLLPHIRLNTRVESVQRKSDQWEVKVSTGDTFTFDLVMVCNGHYRVPHYPEVPGVQTWLKAGKATHSAWYRNPHAINLGNTVLVVGAGPSGTDISKEVLTTCQTVIHSTSGAVNEDLDDMKHRGRLTRLEADGRAIFEDGTVEYGIDHCILATGFETSFPFLPDTVIQTGLPPDVPPLPSKIYNTLHGVFPLAKHILPMQRQFPHWSLVFLGLLVKAVPFPLLEAQAQTALHAFAHPDELDPEQEAKDIITRCEDIRQRVGSDNPLLLAKRWYRVQPLEQFDYRDKLNDFAAGSFPGRKVAAWERLMYLNKNILQTLWVELERSGEAKSWVKGVGEGGQHEWIELLQRMLQRAEEQGLPVVKVPQAKPAV
ncbi:hypothetical protein AMATHDRAFT_4510 [Amanita thiersii Skay4041]|uniref:FAD/NAD(P)-binding domain-containing protein n=1 Tax=Amanita thiersii Skay4041 TaxID=703135 RepID=A0A2A9NQC8_9AGAR|nr:hypothetical protein AMATHDRAFT_4510 [Amanita thiersii Skay4041]